MPSSDSNRGVSAVKQHDEFYLRDGNICFLVESTIFRLHKYFFERESDYFRERFQTSNKADDGSQTNPYIIYDVKTDEFAQFVWIWYNPRYSFSKQTKEKWLTILKLATMWRFHDIRQLAIRQLEKIKLEPIEKITTYKEHKVGNELLLPSYVSLCRSPKLPSPEEGKILTMDTVLRLANAREEVLRRASELGCKTPSTAGAPDDLVEAIVAKLFELGVRPHTSGDAVMVADAVTVKQPDPSKKAKPADLDVTPQHESPLKTAGNNGKLKMKYGV